MENLWNFLLYFQKRRINYHCLSLDFFYKGTVKWNEWNEFLSHTTSSTNNRFGCQNRNNINRNDNRGGRHYPSRPQVNPLQGKTTQKKHHKKTINILKVPSTKLKTSSSYLQTKEEPLLYLIKKTISKSAMNISTVDHTPN